MDNEIGGVVVGLLEKKRSPSRGGVITGVGAIVEIQKKETKKKIKFKHLLAGFIRSMTSVLVVFFLGFFGVFVATHPVFDSFSGSRNSREWGSG